MFNVVSVNKHYEWNPIYMKTCTNCGYLYLFASNLAEIIMCNQSYMRTLYKHNYNSTERSFN